jgi:peptidoglycan biosynthesis protein MviN/MurJ (putative lipid II flippase)
LGFVSIAPWIGSAATIGTFLFSELATNLLYQRGQFTQEDTRHVAELINVYALQYPFFLTCTAGFTLISALSRNHAFIRLNLILLATDILGNIIFMQLFGIKGIALTTATIYAVSLVSMNVYLVKNGLVKFSMREIRNVIMALLCLTISLLLLRFFDLAIGVNTSIHDYQCIFAILVAFAGAAYFFTKDQINLFRLSIEQAGTAN